MNRLDTLLALLALDRMPRMGWVMHGIPDAESIAGHVLASAQLACLLAPRVEPALDLGRLLRLVVLHDAPEALTGDLPRSAGELLPSGAKRAMEEGAARRLFEEAAPEALEAWREYSRGETREARFARLCDRLQLALRLLAYRRAGQRGLDELEHGLVTLEPAEFAPLDELRSELLQALRALPRD